MHWLLLVCLYRFFVGVFDSWCHLQRDECVDFLLTVRHVELMLAPR